MLENGKMGLLRRVFEAIFGHNVINRLFFKVISGILGTIRGHLFWGIHGLRPANLNCRVRLCVTPVDDNVERVIDYRKKNTITFKGLDVVRQYAALLERRVQSSTRVRKARAVTKQTKHIRNLLPQCASDATGFLSDVYKKSTRARKFLADGVQYGRSMIEMLGVLAIIAVLSVGGISGYSKAMEKWKIDKTIDYLTQIATNVQTLYMQQKSYEGLSDSTALQAGVYPENNWNLPLGKNTDVRLRASEDGALFGLRICGLTARQCLALTTQQWGGNANGLYGISIVLAHNFLNGAAGIKQTGQGCSGKIEIKGAYFVCAEGGNNIISFDMANKYCNRAQQDGTVCMGLFFR